MLIVDVQKFPETIFLIYITAVLSYYYSAE